MSNQVTFFCDFKDISSVANPLIDKSTRLRLIGGFEKNWKQNNISFENSGFGIKKKNGCIYTNNYNNLFSMGKGYVNIVLSIPRQINNGIIDGIEDLSGNYNKWIIWGTNVGELGPVYPSINLQFTSEGIEFQIKNERGVLSILDDITTRDESEIFSIECMWDCDGIDDFSEINNKITVAYRVDGVTKIISNFPLTTENEISNFCILNTPFLNSNVEMTIIKLIVADGPTIDIDEELHSSSSSSSSNSSSSFSTSSASTLSSLSSKSSSSSSSRSSDSSLSQP